MHRTRKHNPASTPTLYSVLGLPPASGPELLHARYLQLAIEYHPDTHPGDKAREEKFKDLTIAYTTLKDPERRRAYDGQLKMLGGECSRCEGKGLIAKSKGFTQRSLITCELCFGTGRSRA